MRRSPSDRQGWARTGAGQGSREAGRRAGRRSGAARTWKPRRRDDGQQRGQEQQRRPGKRAPRARGLPGLGRHRKPGCAAGWSGRRPVGAGRRRGASAEVQRSGPRRPCGFACAAPARSSPAPMAPTRAPPAALRTEAAGHRPRLLAASGRPLLAAGRRAEAGGARGPGLKIRGFLCGKRPGKYLLWSNLLFSGSGNGSGSSGCQAQ